MKRVIMILSLSLIFFGCGPSREEIEQKARGEGQWSTEGFTIERIAGQDFQTITIDSCEYIYHYGHRSESLIHKANCKNHK